MKRLTLLIMLLVAAPQSYAWTVGGTLNFSNGKAIATVYGYSDRLEILVHTMTVTAIIKEEGQVVASVPKNCTKPIDENGFPLDLHCDEAAIDPTLTDTCRYCGNGTSEAFSFLVISLGTKYWSKCRVYNAGPGNR